MTMPARCGCLLVCGAALAALDLPQAANAQPTPDRLRTESVLDLPRAGYEPRTIKLGNVVFAPELYVSTIYDSNIYATRTDQRSDAVFSIQPKLTFQQRTERLQWHAEASGDIRRYASNHTENSTNYGVTADASYAASTVVNLSAGAGYHRAVENRSDPEARQGPTQEQLVYDVLNGDLALRIGRNRFRASLQGQVERYDFASSLDDDREFTSYRGTLRVLYRFGAATNAFVQGYVNKRDFRIRDPITGVNRDSRTFGGLVGVQIDPGGKLRGDVGAGVFHYDPADPTLRGFSGFALQGSLTYAPRTRTALTLDLFSGDVATVRTGASGRIDRRLHLAIQQEIRHNLLASAGVGIGQTRYRGVDEKLTTFGADAQVEYLLSGHFSVALVGQFAKRTSGTISKEFERFRIGAAIRARY